jgi:hypothetical protein
MGYIQYFHDGFSFNQYIDVYNRFPDYCPLCRKSILPKYIFLHYKINGNNEVLCSCPNSECSSLFFVEYKKIADNKYSLERYYPESKKIMEFPKEVESISPNFIKIFNQAHHAEKEGLDLICGVGYRKALEYLIKDYIISEHPNDAEKVKANHKLQQCINTYIDDSDIKEMAERASWLGNDETHYVKKRNDKDIQDLKNLIDLTVFFVGKKLKAKKYKEEMA